MNMLIEEAVKVLKDMREEIREDASMAVGEDLEIYLSEELKQIDAINTVLANINLHNHGNSIPMKEYIEEDDNGKNINIYSIMRYDIVASEDRIVKAGIKIKDEET